MRTRHDRDDHIHLDGDKSLTKANRAQHTHCGDRNGNDSGREDDGARDDDSHKRGGARNRNRKAETITPKPRSESRKAEAAKSKPPQSRDSKAEAAKEKRSSGEIRVRKT